MQSLNLTKNLQWIYFLHYLLRSKDWIIFRDKLRQELHVFWFLNQRCCVIFKIKSGRCSKFKKLNLGAITNLTWAMLKIKPRQGLRISRTKAENKKIRQRPFGEYRGCIPRGSRGAEASYYVAHILLSNNLLLSNSCRPKLDQIICFLGQAAVRLKDC